MRLSIFNVNSQEGFLSNEECEIVGAFNKHLKRVFVKVPYEVKPKDLPEACKGFSLIHDLTDGFTIQCWTANGYRDLGLTEGRKKPPKVG